MKSKILVLVLVLPIQSCTIIGIIIDTKHPTKNDFGKTQNFAEMGLNADVKVLESIKNDAPLFIQGANQKIVCKNLKKNQQVDCIQ
jgi:hypothetical protein